MKEISELKKGDVCFIRAQVSDLSYTSARFNTIDDRGNILLYNSFGLWLHEHKAVLTADDLLHELNPTMKYEETEENKPKYAPCRKVKRGDRVKPRIVYGRTPIFGIDGIAVDISSGDFIVETDEGERPNGTVDVKTSDGTTMTIDPVYLELVTPAEELEPFYVDYITPDDDEDLDDNPCWCVKYRKHDDIVSIFYRNTFEDPEKTRAAAEAECKRLNEEYRKEQNNGEPDKRVCTCGAGYFCTFECETCDAFKEPEDNGKRGVRTSVRCSEEGKEEER